MSLGILFRDELNGFYRSKVMLFLWVGLPSLGLLLYYAQPSAGQTPLSSFIALVVSAIGGTLSSVMLAVTIINEKERKVYDLFVIRPIKRWEIIISKFLAVFLCVVVAATIAILLGLAVDTVRMGALPSNFVGDLLSSFAITLGMIGISSSASALIGIAAPSVLVGVIAVLYGSNQLSAAVILPVLLMNASALLTIGVSLLITGVLLALACVYFERKQL